MTEMIASTLRLATPLIFAALGGLICERSGIATICLEGVLLFSAWTAATVGYFTGNPYFALTCGMVAGTVLIAVHAFLTVTSRSDQIISGVVVNLLALGLTPLISKVLFGSPTNTPSLTIEQRLGVWKIPGLSSIPEVGQALFSHSGLVYLSWILPFALHYFLYRTRWGLRLNAAGDNPEALETCGVPFRRVRWLAILTGGALASLGGVYLSISHASQFTRGMSAGRGFIALTAVIFGKWRPLPTFFACLFFGLTDALQIQLQSTSLGDTLLPVQLVQALPYIITLVVLVGFVGRSKAPLALGIRQ
jgi:ABC-type uncharacterized transport system permease subunit